MVVVIVLAVIMRIWCVVEEMAVCWWIEERVEEPTRMLAVFSWQEDGWTTISLWREEKIGRRVQWLKKVR